jgi:predicted nuclease of predicted toxin-antitoxin system
VRVKLDENLPDSVLSILAGAGHDVDTARAEGLRGAKDPAVLAGATADGRLLLTLDRGLGDIRAYPPGTHAGIVVVRLNHQSSTAGSGSRLVSDLGLQPLGRGLRGLLGIRV